MGSVGEFGVTNGGSLDLKGYVKRGGNMKECQRQIGVLLPLTHVAICSQRSVSDHFEVTDRGCDRLTGEVGVL